MSVLLILIPVSVLIAGFFVMCFILSSKNGQFEDLETPAFRILSEDKVSEEENSQNSRKKDG